MNRTNPLEVCKVIVQHRLSRSKQEFIQESYATNSG